MMITDENVRRERRWAPAGETPARELVRRIRQHFLRSHA
jgi:hypothetical protein